MTFALQRDGFFYESLLKEHICKTFIFHASCRVDKRPTVKNFWRGHSRRPKCTLCSRIYRHRPPATRSPFSTTFISPLILACYNSYSPSPAII
ncbi:hypothetical protein K469DRAFT_725 [Zopfia rhizophila CBS 207.26]|uniref:Uncharacterized protein n=1 Tax=Zopfia rhizophila CBS 207.26 TaxID=1314779 RepID=A0A6A6EUI0_9PEZI|nr:hypothetical protein K469DRAFT_725 [Zopfia rhizophila CBS 207.26]